MTNVTTELSPLQKLVGVVFKYRGGLSWVLGGGVGSFLTMVLMRWFLLSRLITIDVSHTARIDHNTAALDTLRATVGGLSPAVHTILNDICWRYTPGQQAERFMNCPASIYKGAPGGPP